ncbi:NAD-dependent epimerase/dehydratase family protein [Nitrospirillum iridis]|uniref:UDP-glucose 4-epimerase n=1 Tax=Nitrospirillum iridis TaxID=765888 RepID=A0A7X0EFY7_9PROT|nr:NAD-dependent epimerase/dehydratase family protein [Nitrospirillum iridis]MBB6254445.1 UDP-glucose 4-epimerase [Nitrospirillum iridis]
MIRAADEAATAISWAGARVLVAGGLGFIGARLACRLVTLGAVVTVVDALEPQAGGNIANVADIRDQATIRIADLGDPALLRDLLPGCDVVFNLAGQTGHLASMVAPLQDLDANCRAPLALLEACRTLAPQVTVVYASTRQVYGRPIVLPVDERHPLAPVDINGVHKAAAEAYHGLYWRVHGLDTRVLRLTNTYGPGMRVKDAKQNFLGLWLRQVLEGRPIELWGGHQRRDFSYVDDTVRALLEAARVPMGQGRILNVGGCPPVSLRELAEQLLAQGGGDGGLVVSPFPSDRERIDIGDYYTDDSLFRGLTGWAPETSLAEGLRATLDYYRAALPLYL